MSLITQSDATRVIPAVYTPLTRAIGSLQQIQRNLAAHPHATLRDATRFVLENSDYSDQAAIVQDLQSLQAEHGDQAELETIIQLYVARQLAHQIALRPSRKVLVVA